MPNIEYIPQTTGLVKYKLLAFKSNWKQYVAKSVQNLKKNVLCFCNGAKLIRSKNFRLLKYISIPSDHCISRIVYTGGPRYMQ